MTLITNETLFAIYYEIEYFSTMKKIETSNSLLKLDSKGIVWLSFPKKTNHTLDSMKEYFEAINTLDLNKEGILLLVTMNKLSGISKEARDLVKHKTMAKAHKAVAMVVTSILSKMIASFFLGFNKPPFPIKSFTKNEDALAWLKRQI